jgi:predicted DNA-binding protein YlxM (UPF0122 family)
MSNEQDTFSLAKGLHHINIAKQYFEDFKMGCVGEIKNTVNNYINKCEWILNNIYDKLGEQTRKVYKEEMSDSLSLDSINDKLMILDNAQRLELEDMLDAIIKGKKVTVKIEENESSITS